MPAESTAIPPGLDPVVPRIVETPFGVIFDTLFVPELAVYTLPAESTTIARGSVSTPVSPRIVDAANAGAAPINIRTKAIRIERTTNVGEGTHVRCR